MKIESFDYTIDLLQSVLWQYDDADRIISLITQKQAWYTENVSQFWTDWYTNVFNLLTANDFGLMIWSIILNVPYLIPITPTDKPIVGFNTEPPENPWVNFDRGTFADNGSSRPVLRTEEQRLFLRLRYFQLISNGTVPFINFYMNLLFNDPSGLYVGGAWVLDNFDMSMEYQFNCPISPGLFEAITQYNVLSKPTGVSLTYTIL